jgi:hypothetical protein
MIVHVRTALTPLLALALGVAVGACMPVQLRTQPAPISACDAALASGRLVSSPRSGLALGNAAGVVTTEVVWPFGYAARRDATGLVLLDSQEPDGTVLAREGDWIEVGGGSDGSGAFVVCPASLRVTAPAGGS